MLEEAELEEMSSTQLRAFLAAFVSELCKRVSPSAVLLAAKDAWTQRSVIDAGHQAPPTAAAPPPDVLRGPSHSATNSGANLAAASKNIKGAPGGDKPLAASVPHGRPPPQHKLVFRHDCRSTACSDSECKLCACNPIMPCGFVLRPPPLSYRPKEPLCAPCGADIYVELQDAAGQVAHPDWLTPSAVVLIIAIDAQAYEEMSRRASSTPHEPDSHAILMTPAKGHVLGMNEAAGPMLGIPIYNSRASLKGLHFLTDMDSLAPAAQGGFRLLARIVDERTGRSLEHAQGVLSDVFTVTSHALTEDRTGVLRSGSDPLEMLPNISAEVVETLSDIPRLVSALQSKYPHFQGFSCQHKSIKTIAQMRALLTSVSAHSFNTTILRESLKFSPEEWKAFVTNVCKALKPDNYVRCWSCPLQDVQLHVLFGCHSGNINFAVPLGVKSSGKLTRTSELTEENHQRVYQLLPWAKAQWQRPGHPGWSIVQDLDTQDLLNGATEDGAGRGVPSHMPVPTSSAPLNPDTDSANANTLARGPHGRPDEKPNMGHGASWDGDAQRGQANVDGNAPYPRGADDNQGSAAYKVHLRPGVDEAPPLGGPQPLPGGNGFQQHERGAPAHEGVHGSNAASAPHKRPREDSCADQSREPTPEGASKQARRVEEGPPHSSGLMLAGNGSNGQGADAARHLDRFMGSGGAPQGGASPNASVGYATAVLKQLVSNSMKGEGNASYHS